MHCIGALLPPPVTTTDRSRRRAFDKRFGHIWSSNDLDLWPFDFKIQSVSFCRQVHQICKFGEILANGLWSTVFTNWWTQRRSHAHTDGRPDNIMPPPPVQRVGIMRYLVINWQPGGACTPLFFDLLILDLTCVLYVTKCSATLPLRILWNGM